MIQYNLNFDNFTSYSEDNFLISDSNKLSYKFLLQNKVNINNIFLFGPKKSGKSHLSAIWCKRFDAIKLNLNKTNIRLIDNLNENILIEDVFNNLDEEKLFHIINNLNKNKKILLNSHIEPKKYQFKLNDLSSRIKTFNLIKISMPDDYLISNLIIKLFNDKQIKIKNKEVINYLIPRIERSFENVYALVKKIDKYSLSNKRNITIKLIKEII